MVASDQTSHSVARPRPISPASTVQTYDGSTVYVDDGLLILVFVSDNVHASTRLIDEIISEKLSFEDIRFSYMLVHNKRYAREVNGNMNAIALRYSCQSLGARVSV